MDITDEKKRIEIFCCYARKDQPLLIDLKKHLKLWERQGLITIWTDTDINPGTNWEKEIIRHVKAADIILFLVSPDFLVSDYCYGTEMKCAMERYERGEAYVIPIILRHCVWEEAPFGKMQALPADAKPVIGPGWHNMDEAFTNIAQSIRNVMEELRFSNDNAYRVIEPNEASKRNDQLLSSHVILINAALDPHDSPYEQTIEDGRKKIYYKGFSSEKGVENH